MAGDSSICCWPFTELPSASISSNDSISFSPRLEKLSGCESSRCKQSLCPCTAATDIALKIKLKNKSEINIKKRNVDEKIITVMYNIITCSNLVEQSQSS